MLLSVMGRKYEGKTNRGNNKEDLEKAADAVKNLGKSIRSAANDCSVCHVSLYRHCMEGNKLELKGSKKKPSVGYHIGRRVFNESQEKEPTSYLLQASNAYFGLSPKEVLHKQFFV